MRAKHLLSLIFCSSLILVSYTRPLSPQAPSIRPRAKYSVVAVDGGSDDSAVPTNAPDHRKDTTTVMHTMKETDTVTAPAMTQPPATETRTTTEIVHKERPAKTVETVVTKSVQEETEPTAKPEVPVVNAAPVIPTLQMTHTTTRILTVVSTVNHPVHLLTSSSVQPPTSTSASSTSSSLLAPSIAPSGPSSPKWQEKQDDVRATATVSATRLLQTEKSLENGTWHASYPSWNATSATDAARYPPDVRGSQWRKG